MGFQRLVGLFLEPWTWGRSEGGLDCEKAMLTCPPSTAGGRAPPRTQASATAGFLPALQKHLLPRALLLRDSASPPSDGSSSLHLNLGWTFLPKQVADTVYAFVFGGKSILTDA